MANIVYALDVNSAWGKDLSGVIATHKPTHIVLHTYHGYEAAGLPAFTIAQAASAQAAGVSVGMYAWAFLGYSPVKTVNDSVALFKNAAGHDPPVVWLDCEIYSSPGQPDFDPGPDPAWLTAAFARCDELGLRAGVYTGQWWLDQYFPGGSPAFMKFNDRYLWWANWDRDPELTGAKPPGWPTLHGKQWAVRLPPYQTIDRDVFIPEVTVPV
jgi:hypothetical protein